MMKWTKEKADVRTKSSERSESVLLTEDSKVEKKKVFEEYVRLYAKDVDPILLKARRSES